jgi:4-alpha-glucanotransferase
MSLNKTDALSTDMRQRRAGVLLHPTSLPSGVLDADVDKWLKFMADSGLSIWQVLPLCEPQLGLSPYQCSSTFALNTALLADYPEYNKDDANFAGFCEQQKFWLDDYVMFKVLKHHFHDAPWSEWPSKWKFRDSETLDNVKHQHFQAITDLKWEQYQLYSRWQQIHQDARQKGILLFGDLPIFVGHDSADVWAHPEWFLLDSQCNMEVVTGVPPDYFSETGQRWGNPHYNWDAMLEDDFVWWKARIKHHLDMFDLLRIDHFRGLEAAWMIDASCETAVDGYWKHVPGDKLFAELQSDQKGSDQLPFVAEDLGIITPEVTALRKKYNLPGMSILQFAFDEFEDNPHKPRNIGVDQVVYTGTHDNDTTKGWFNSLEDRVKNYILSTLGLDDETDNPHVTDIVIETMISNAMSSKASICIIPMQDCLHLGSEARMNTPGTVTNNWKWQFTWQQIESDMVEKIHQRVEKSQRLVGQV